MHAWFQKQALPCKNAAVDIPGKPFPPALWPALTSGVEASCLARVKSSANVTTAPVAKIPNRQLATEMAARSKAPPDEGLQHH